MRNPDRRQASSWVKQTSFLPKPTLSIARDLNAPEYLENGHFKRNLDSNEGVL